MNCIIKICCTFFISGILSLSVSAQVVFTKVDNFIEGGNNTFVPIISVDMNGDNVDDIVHFDNGETITIHLSNKLGRDWQQIDGPTVSNNMWSAIVVDLNNDGYKEIICGSLYSTIPIYSYNYDTNTFTEYQVLPENFFVQNMNAVDINKDGWSDLFMCNDLGENIFYINNNGVLEVEQLIDFSTEPEISAAGNYASQFLDFDMDGDEDLYISKCSGFASFDTDPRRINQFYINDGSGNFTEMGADFGINSGAQTWTSDFADLDLDGDLDLLVANHEHPLQLFENIDNQYFQEIEDLTGLNPTAVFYQLILVDVDNDGKEDVIITEDGVEVYLNKGDFVFEAVTSEFDFPNVSSTFSAGDYDSDGSIDLVMKAGSFNSISPTEIFMQKQSANNYINFQLEGVQDMRDALGSRVELFYENGIQNRILRYGRSYGVQLSNQLHFGLGQAQKVDSVRVYWLNGDVETIVDPEINKSHFIRQNSCVQKISSAEVIQDTKCASQDLILSHVEDSFLDWNTGATSTELVSGEEGLYFFNYGTGDCILESWKSYVEFQEIAMATETRYVLDEQGLLPCPGQEILIDVGDENALWNGNVTSSTILSNSIDDITVQYEGNCTEYDVTYKRNEVEYGFEAPEEVYDFVSGDDVEIDVQNGDAEWYDDINGLPFHEGSSFIFENVQQNETIFILNRKLYEYQGTVGVEEIPDNASQTISTLNVRFDFRLNEALRLMSMKVQTNAPGLRKFEMYDECGVFLHSVEQTLVAGENVVEWDIELDEGEYYVTSDEETNLANLGGKGPLLFSHTVMDGEFPFVDMLGMMSIDKGALGNNKYYFYYDWKIGSLTDKECQDGFYETELKSISSTGNLDLVVLKYNSVVESELSLELEGNHTFSIHDSRGVLLTTQSFIDRGVFVMGNYASGVYYVVCDGQVYSLVKL